MNAAPGTAALAVLVRDVAERAVLGFDVDGVLAPIVGHADEARLTPGVHDDLVRLAERSPVAVVSGRSLDDLERRFDFDPRLHLIGSHGLETRGGPRIELTDLERRRFAVAERLALAAIDRAGPGAWVERKPASIVVHTRTADTDRARVAVDRLVTSTAAADELHVTLGHEVAEIFVRPASKGRALDALRRTLGLPSLVHVGDDVTDESVFELMGPDDVGIRVGPGATAAKHRLRSPTDVAELLSLLVAA